MNETRRTLTYVVAAAALALVAWKLSPPVEITPKEFEAAKIGTEFWPDFKDPNAPTSIRVVGFDEAKATHQSFGVKFENGKWTIPSHHNYPADGADRLAKTAASVMHIKREEIASDSDQNDEKLGVVDPLDEDRTKLKGRGKRITLSEGENTFVDLIVGKEVKDRPGFFYIRKPGEKMTYVAKVKIDLSTKFADWVETDLLKIDRNDLKEVVIDDYSIDEANGRLVAGDISKLTRDKSADPWKLDGLDEAKEELDTSKINALIGALDDLRLVGVRPKPKGLRPDLTIDPEFVKLQSDLDRLRFDMQSRGFILQPDRKKKQLRIYSNEGELAAATSKGVVYTLQFGEIFSGDESEIEIGAAKDETAVKEKKGPKEGDEPDGDGKPKSKDSAGKQPSRYLFVTTRFDEQYLGPAPEEPEEPASSGDESAGAPKIKPKKTQKSKPAPDTDADDDDEATPPAKGKTSKPDDADEEGEQKPAKPEDECGPPSGIDDKPEPAAGENDKNEAKKPDEAARDSKEDTEDSAGETPDDEKKDAKPKDAKPKKSSDDLKKEYEAKHKKYTSDLKAYEDKVAEGKKLVDELNARFGDWYYVISADSFNKLHLSHKELVKGKAKSAADAKDDGKGAKTTDPDEKPDADADDPDEN